MGTHCNMTGNEMTELCTAHTMIVMLIRKGGQEFMTIATITGGGGYGQRMRGRAQHPMP